MIARLFMMELREKFLLAVPVVPDKDFWSSVWVRQRLDKFIQDVRNFARAQPKGLFFCLGRLIYAEFIPINAEWNHGIQGLSGGFAKNGEEYHVNSVYPCKPRG